MTPTPAERNPVLPVPPPARDPWSRLRIGLLEAEVCAAGMDLEQRDLWIEMLEDEVDRLRHLLGESEVPG